MCDYIFHKMIINHIYYLGELPNNLEKCVKLDYSNNHVTKIPENFS
jgi:hypothetical protein